MRLDHLLSKEEVGAGYAVKFSGELENQDISGVDALMGHTRSHPEHDG